MNVSRANRCPGCWAEVRVGAGHHGQTAPCPSCGVVVAITAPESSPDDVVYPALRAEPCPLCGTDEPQPVKWTVWGGFLGPALFHHVRCRKCRYCYNGVTGRSNLGAAVMFLIASFPLLGALLILIAALL